jgi:hypothetical protein
MKVGNRVFSGKGAREEAANALTHAILSWRDDQTMQPRGAFRGFEILSRGKTARFGILQEDERLPDLFIRGRGMYSANFNASSPIGTVQSIEHTLRNLDKFALDQKNRVARVEKELHDYQMQADRPFEHEARLKDLLARQAELNSLLDLDKGDQQGAAPATDKDELETECLAVAPSRVHEEVAKRAAEYMRASDTAIRELPIRERTPPQTGSITGTAVAKGPTHIAVATAANSFVVLASSSLDHDVQIGERLSLRFQHGRVELDYGRNRRR